MLDFFFPLVIFCPPLQIAMFIGFLEYVISQIVAKPGYIPGDYVGANDLFSEEGAHSQWDTYQVNTDSSVRLF